MSELERDASWRRLDTRMLLVHPVTEVVRFLPVIIGVFILGSSGEDNGPWRYLGIAIPIVIGVVRFASTRFRITAAQIELRRGILGRSTLTAPLDRVRTVELTASPIHRVLGLEKVEIGTGSANRNGDGQLVLDSLGGDEARRLRRDLLHRTGAPGAPDAAGIDDDPAYEGDVLVRFDPAWVRYAPLTTSGLVIALAALGAVSGPFFGNGLEVRLEESDFVDRLSGVALPLVVGAALVVLLAASSMLAIIGYLLANWGLVLMRDDLRRTFHVRRGALTTRETSIDVNRLRGLEIHEPLGLRLGGGGRLSAVATGLNRRSTESTTLVPAAPRSVVIRVGGHVLGESGPLAVTLTLHGPAARRRRYLRALVGTGLVPVVLTVLAVTEGWPAWLALLGLLAPVAGVLLARDRYDGLGHALTGRHLVVRSGSLQGRRDVLQRTGIIGWNISQTWFQRRAGLVTLTATIAAGRQAYRAFDIPEPVAIALADEAVPGLLSAFVVRSAS